MTTLHCIVHMFSDFMVAYLEGRWLTRQTTQSEDNRIRRRGATWFCSSRIWLVWSLNTPYIFSKNLIQTFHIPTLLDAAKIFPKISTAYKRRYRTMPYSIVQHYTRCTVSYSAARLLALHHTAPYVVWTALKLAETWVDWWSGGESIVLALWMCHAIISSWTHWKYCNNDTIWY